MVTSVDGNKCKGSGKSGYKKARLLPGRHVIAYSNYVYKLGHVTGKIDLELKAGHSYEFAFDTCYWCNPRRDAAWVEDKTTGEIVWGKCRDWPFWFF
jgi:hypothetical protein